ncbi:aspartate 1-decarboxylase [Helicobacter brantae]|uniref:Aspartate 1-decarboxylase n=1 Tax=Helicobacter brantae TaxID=375927 RepID=A0A3D8J1R7_9HELI|nr:aspartate 1-decarboxylase [Helicobacter brantae]RDU70804.1 aspartate 1-decarboxylase [Helicobacter brantae]
MTLEMLFSKIHRATVTDANLNYEGSITIDEELAKSANLYEGIKVDIVNINNGERFSTYVIYGEKHSGTICLNGAAARKVHTGDKIIIIAYANYSDEELRNYRPTVILLDDDNKIQSIKYEV